MKPSSGAVIGPACWNPFGEQEGQEWRDIAAPYLGLRVRDICQPYYACWFDLLLLILRHIA